MVKDLNYSWSVVKHFDNYFASNEKWFCLGKNQERKTFLRPNSCIYNYRKLITAKMYKSILGKRDTICGNSVPGPVRIQFTFPCCYCYSEHPLKYLPIVSSIYIQTFYNPFPSGKNTSTFFFFLHKTSQSIKK